MPFIPEEELNNQAQSPTTPQAYIDDSTYEPDLTDIWRAHAEQNYWPVSVGIGVGSYWEQYIANNNFLSPPEEGYDPFDDAQTGGFELYASDWAESKSSAQTRIILRGIKRRLSNNDIIAEGGWAGFGSALAQGVLDPINLLPFGFLSKGRGLAAGAVEGVLAGGAAMSLDEALLANSQGSTRGWDEILMNIGSGALLTGVLGGALGAYGKEVTGSATTEGLGRKFALELNNMILDVGDKLNGPGVAEAFRKAGYSEQEIADWLKLRPPAPAKAAASEAATVGAGGSPQSVGAAAVVKRGLADNEPLPAFGTIAAQKGRANPFANPVTDGITSPSNVVRNITREMAEMPILFSNELGDAASPQAVASLAKRWEGSLARAISEADKIFVKYRVGEGAWFPWLRSGVSDITGRTKAAGKITHEQFREQVGIALRNMDQAKATDALMNAGQPAEVAQAISAAAKVYRRHIDALKDEAISLGLLPPDVKVETAASYFTRIYDTERIIRNRDKFEGIIVDWLKRDKLERTTQDPKIYENWKRLRDSAKENIEAIKGGKEIDKADADIAKAEKTAKTERQASRIAKRESAIFGRRLERLQKVLVKARERLARFKPTDKLAKDDPLSQLIEDARTLKKEPARLVEAVRERGGVKDPGGDLKSRGFKPIRYDKNGKMLKREGWEWEIIDSGGDSRKNIHRGMDDTADAMAEAGFLERKFGPDGPEGVDPDELTDALELDAASKKPGERVYALYGDGSGDVERYLEALNFRKELEDAGVSLDWKNERIAYEIGAINDYKPDTPVRQERVRGAGYYVRKIEKDIDAEDKLASAANERLAKSSEKAAASADSAKALRARAFELTRQLHASERQFDHYSKAINQHDEIMRLDDSDYGDVARGITDRILGNDGRGMWDAVQLNGRSLKERTLGIPDNYIDGTGPDGAASAFLENDVERVMRMYTRQMGADVELTKKFGRADLRDQISEIKDDYAKLRAAIKPDDPKAEAKRADLQRKLDRDIRNVEVMRDRLKGVHGLPKTPQGMLARGSVVARNFNLLRQGGGFTLSAIPDIGGLVGVHGMMRVFGSGLRDLVTNVRLVAKNMQEVKDAGTALDLILDTRAHAIADIGDDYGRHSKFERGLKYAADKFGIVNAMSVWNAFMKQYAGTLTISTVLKLAKSIDKGNGIDPKQAKRLRWLGIDDDMARRIAEQHAKFGEEDNGVLWPNLDAWKDRDAQEAFRAAIVKDVDTTIVTPGLEKPIWMTSSEAGKIIGQFRSFTVASMVRTTARMAQRRDAEALQGFIFMTMLGAMSYALKVPGDKLSDDPAVWVKEGIDRSGALGWLFEVNNMVEKVSGNTVGLSPMLGQRPASRFASRGALGAVMGPTFGLAEDTLGLAGAAATDTWSDRDTHKARQLLPYQNLFYLRHLFDELERGIKGEPQESQQ